MKRPIAPSAARLSEGPGNEEFIASLQRTIESQNGTIQLQAQRIAELERQVEWFQNQMFGRKTERRLNNEKDEGNEDIDALPPESETAKEHAERISRKSGKKHQNKRDDQELLGQLLVDPEVPREIITELPAEIAGLTAGVDYEIISTDVSYKVAVRPRSYVVLEIRRPQVKLLCEGDKGKKGSIVTAPVPGAVIDRSIADVSLLAYLLVLKFVYHMPLYRVHQMLGDSGVHISRSTLVRWVIRISELLKPIYTAQFSSILQSELIAMDEVPCRVGLDPEKPGKMRKAYFWPVYGDKDEVAFPYAKSREKAHVAEILGEYCGTLLSDGYAAYASYVEDRDGEVIHAGCWVHWRRKFLSAEKLHPERVNAFIELYAKLNDIETRARTEQLSPEDHHQLRQDNSAVLVDEIFLFVRDALQNDVLLPSDPLRLAIEYGLSREENLRRFLRYPALPLDTNHLERALRRIPMGRQAWLFCWKEVGGIAVGIIQSLIATCQLQEVDPYTYLVDVLQRIDILSATKARLLTPRLWKEHFLNDPLRAPLERGS